MIRFLHTVLISTAVLMLAALPACKKEAAGSGPKEAPPAKETAKPAISKGDREFRAIQTELKLAQKKIPYLVLDLPRKVLAIKLAGVVVWSYPMDVEEKDSDNLSKFADHFLNGGSMMLRPVLDKYLFSGKEKSSDSVLEIVSAVVYADVQLMQRQIPERFEILWDNDLIMEIRTDVVGKPLSEFKNTMVQIRRILERPFGEAKIVIRMDADHAITLYRAVNRGVPTLLIPAN